MNKYKLILLLIVSCLSHGQEQQVQDPLKKEIDKLIEKEYISDFPGEIISIQTLKLRNINNDLHIAGNNGMDIRLDRLIKSPGVVDVYVPDAPTLNTTSRYNENRSTDLGCLGSVSSIGVSLGDDNFLRPVGIDNSSMVPAGTQVLFNNNMSLACEGNIPVIHAPDGKKHFFSLKSNKSESQEYQLDRTEDIHGNYIKYERQDGFIQSITRNDGVYLEFEYVENGLKPKTISKIKYGEHEISYGYTHHRLRGKELTEFTDFSGHQTKYTYYDDLGYLKSVENHLGLKVEYGYHALDSDSLNQGFDQGIRTKKLSGRGVSTRNYFYHFLVLSDSKRTVEWEYNIDGKNDLVSDWKVISHQPSSDTTDAPRLSTNGKIKQARTFLVPSSLTGASNIYLQGNLIAHIENDWEYKTYGVFGCPKSFNAFGVDAKQWYCSRAELKKRETKIILSDNKTFETYQNEYMYDHLGRVIFHIGKNGSNTLQTISTYKNHEQYWKMDDVESTSISKNNIDWHEEDRIDYYNKSENHPYKIKSIAKYGRNIISINSYNDDGTPNNVIYGNNTNRWIKLSNYKFNKPSTVTTPSSNKSGTSVTEKITFDSFGNINEKTDLDGFVSKYSYSPDGKLLGVSYADTTFHPTTIAYTKESGDLGGEISLETRGNYRKEITYSSLGLPIYIKEWDADIGTQSERYKSFSYDNEMNKTFESLPSDVNYTNNGYIYKFDALGRLIESSLNGKNTTKTYLPGNVVRTTDPNLNVTDTTYVSYGSPKFDLVLKIDQPDTTDEKGLSHENITSFERNIHGNIIKVTQGGISELRIYDPHQQICVISRSDIGIKKLTYNSTGEIEYLYEGASGTGLNCDGYTASASKAVKHTYDDVGNIHKIEYADSTPSVTYNWDNRQNLVSLDNGISIWDFGIYNVLSLPAMEQLTVNNEIFRKVPEYDSYGNITKIIYPSGLELQYNINALGQQTQIRDDETIYASDVKYHADGTVKSFIYGNGATFSKLLNTYNLPESIEIHTSDVSIYEKRLDYDSNLNLTLVEDLSDTHKTLSMKYDYLDRLSKIESNSLFGESYFYYDGISNISQMKTGNTELNYLYQNGLLKSVSNGYVIAHDDRGNVIDNGNHSFSYNRANRLTSSGDISYAYDGFGRRVKKSSSGQLEYTFYDKKGQLLFSKTPAGSTDFIYLSGQLIAKHLSAHTVTGDAPGYTGHIEDKDLDLTYMQARYYDPVIGRFYSNDPVDALDHMNRGNPTMGFNRYTYANNNPYKYTDPDGEFAILAWFATPPGIAALEYTGSALVGIMGGVAIAEAFDNTENSDNSAPGLPDGLVGDQSDDRAGPSRGKRHNSGPLTPENGGTGNAEEDFEKLTGGTGKPAEGRKEGTRIGKNGITIRPGKEGEGKRIDIPANGNKPPETLHYDK